MQRDTAATHLILERIMQLQEVLFGSWTQPVESGSRIHRIGFNSIPRYIEPPKRIYKEKSKPASEIMLENIMKKLKEPMTPMQICVMTPWTRNHCGMLLCKLWKDGKLKRLKIKVDNSRTYLYSWIHGEQDE